MEPQLSNERSVPASGPIDVELMTRIITLCVVIAE